MNTGIEANQLTYQFDRFQIDTDGFRLLRDGSPVTLEPKALQLLIFLVANRGRLLEKQQLLDAVWGELSVTENALTRAIALLRRALGDDTKQPRFIETVPTLGYRFICSVQELESHAGSSPAAPISAGSKPHRHFARGRLALAAALVFAIAAGLAVFFLQPKRGGRALPGGHRRRIVQVTFSNGLDVFPSFSPDGNSIAYSSDHSGKLEIYVRQISLNGGEVQITNDGGANIEPAFSPDGQWIAYHSKNKGGVWIVPSLGGTPRKVTDFGSHPAWSHDGSRLAFESGDIGAIIETEVGSSPDSSIWIVSLSDGSLQQVTRKSDTPGEQMFGHSSPQWTAADRRLVFSASGALWSVQADGRDPRRLAPGVFAYDPVLDAEHDRVLFMGSNGSEYGIWELRMDDRGVALGPPQLLHGVPLGIGHYLAVSRDGRRLAFVMLTTHDNLYSISSGESEAKTAAPEPVTQDTRMRKTNPTFSPDGKWVAFGVAQVGRPNQIWIASIDGKRAHQIPVGQSCGNAAWVMNNKLSYWTFNGGATRLWNWDIEENKATEIFKAPSANMGFMRLSPDGKAAAFQRSTDGVINAWTISIPEGHARQITFDHRMAGWPVWSHDGKTLAVEVRTGFSTNIGLTTPQGGTITPLTHDAAQNWPYSWSPNDSKIAFAGFRNGVWNVFSVEHQTGAEKQLTHYASPNIFVRYPDWSPDGKHIVYEYGESNGNIWMLEDR
jgi:Tol biopolymer transport system component/DNA-binding winged helix-turn-helix (wHTH) protein